MKEGQTVFIMHDRDVMIYGEIRTVTEKHIVIRVINGAYDLVIAARPETMPDDAKGDYNTAIEWARGYYGKRPK